MQAIFSSLTAITAPIDRLSLIAANRYRQRLCSFAVMNG
jgi:hypothetical protein